MLTVHPQHLAAQGELLLVAASPAEDVESSGRMNACYPTCVGHDWRNFLSSCTQSAEVAFLLLRGGERKWRKQVRISKRFKGTRFLLTTLGLHQEICSQASGVSHSMARSLDMPLSAVAKPDPVISVLRKTDQSLWAREKPKTEAIAPLSGKQKRFLAASLVNYKRYKRLTSATRGSDKSGTSLPTQKLRTLI